MYNFVLQTIVMLSLGTIIYLMARAAPRVSDSPEPLPKLSRNYFDELFKKLPLEKLDALTSAWLEKSLRKLKVLVMKIDNALNKHLSNLRASDNLAEKPSLFEKKEESDNLKTE